MSISGKDREIAALREALNLAISRGCDHCAESIRKARARANVLAPAPDSGPAPCPYDTPSGICTRDRQNQYCLCRHAAPPAEAMRAKYDDAINDAALKYLEGRIAALKGNGERR